MNSPVTRASLLARLVDPADQAGWREFVSVYGPLVYGEVRRRGFHHADAEDLTQLIFTRLFRGLKTFQYDPGRGRFRDWLGVIVKNEILRGWRDRSRRPAMPMPPEAFDGLAHDAPDPEWVDAFHNHVLNVALDRCRPRFEPATWRAFERVWLREEPVAAVAADAGQTADWVYVAKSRVLKALADAVRELTDDAPHILRRA